LFSKSLERLLETATQRYATIWSVCVRVVRWHKLG